MAEALLMKIVEQVYRTIATHIEKNGGEVLSNLTAPRALLG
jgi:hypothetical protein